MRRFRRRRSRVKRSRAVLAELVDRCLEKRPEARPQSMEEVSASLERVLQSLGGYGSGVSGVSRALAAAAGLEAPFDRAPAPIPLPTAMQLQDSGREAGARASVGPTRIDEVPSLGPADATVVRPATTGASLGDVEVPATVALTSVGSPLQDPGTPSLPVKTRGAQRRLPGLAVAGAALVLIVGTLAVVWPREQAPAPSPGAPSGSAAVEPAARTPAS